MTQRVGLKRNTNDEFYTKPEVASTLLAAVSRMYELRSFDVVVEPSAGQGGFSDRLRGQVRRLDAFDISPRLSYIKQEDFLQKNVDEYLDKRVLVIGNPPFGRQSSIARKFIHRCGMFAQVIAFVLPRSFKKESMKSSFPVTFHLVHEQSVPDNAFTVNGVDHNVPCVFQIWERRETERIQAKPSVARGFAFITDPGEPDCISIRRVGANAGHIDTTCITKTVTTHYFIKLDSSMNKLWFIQKYTPPSVRENTVGPRSISKGELVAHINRLHILKPL